LWKIPIKGDKNSNKSHLERFKFVAYFHCDNEEAIKEIFNELIQVCVKNYPLIYPQLSVEKKLLYQLNS
jgi:hypothetical protein